MFRATIVIGKRATAGISGRSQRLRRAEIAAVTVAYTAAYVFSGALYHAGVSHAIIYGLYAAAAPLIAGGAATAGIAAARADWPLLGTSLAVIAVAADSAFAGPIAVWAFTGAGVFLALLGSAAARARLLRA